jgi:Fe-S cluster biosynthesis and repair protein YggX
MDYLKLGINAIAVNASKQAIFGWKKYQTELITEKELEAQMGDARCKGIAIICGEVSGNL